MTFSYRLLWLRLHFHKVPITKTALSIPLENLHMSSVVIGETTERVIEFHTISKLPDSDHLLKLNPCPVKSKLRGHPPTEAQLKVLHFHFIINKLFHKTDCNKIYSELSNYLTSRLVCPKVKLINWSNLNFNYSISLQQ